jgi:diguanylate cyclase (GGDEF)-like protein/PAS domain S-box-containing protein
LVIVVTIAFICSAMSQWPRLNQFRNRNAFILRIIVLVVGVALLSFSEALERIDSVFYDKISLIQQSSPSSNIVIVSIDEASLQAFGRWPWSRSIHAELINLLAQVGDNVIALDLLFSEAQEDDPAADDALAKAIAAHGSVILPVAPIADADLGGVYLAEPLPMLRENAMLGHVDIELDRDGVARRVFLAAGIDKPRWPAFGLAALTERLNNGEPVSTAYSYEKNASGWAPWVRSQEALIPYVGPSGSFRRISYAQILFDKSLLASLSGKIIIVGMTAVGMGTRFATPVSEINRQPMTGAEWHANVVDMLQHNRVTYPVANHFAVLISASWVLLIILSISLLRGNLTVFMLLVLLAGGLLFIGILLRFVHIWVPPSAALLGTLAIYPLWNWQRINEFMRSMFAAKARSSAALESIEDGVITTDTQDHIIFMNRGAEKILQVEATRLQGKKLQHVLKLNDACQINLYGQQEKPHALGFATDVDCAVECHLETARGDKRIVRIARHQLYDEDEALMGFVIAMANITDTVVLAEQVAHQESHDALTKLPNRTQLLTLFERLIKSTQKPEKIITVFFVALDNFKKVNDAMGRQAGDKLLKMITWRLYEAIGRDDIVARWGGDEFVLLFDYLREEGSTADMAQKILDVMEDSFDLEGMEVFVTISIGISFYTHDNNNIEIVLERAGAAMFRVKREGGNSFGFYSPESSIVWTRDRLELEKELRAAVKDKQLQVYFQPIFDAKLHCIVRMEALVRWLHPKRGFLSPSEFVPLAEDIGLIDQLGELVLRNSCIAANKLLQAGKTITVSVNVDPHQLLYGDFVQIVSQVLRDTGLPAESLILEITESAVVSDMMRASKVLRALKGLGILIALDDFGTGYSSLTLLRELPIDIIKIDQSFVSRLNQNQNQNQNQHDLTIVKAIVGLGKSLGMAIIAEGVETEQQVQLLLDHDCYFHQGYYYSRPLSYDSLVEFMNEKELTGT